MLGAIIGDIVGSAYEFNPTNDYDFTLFPEDANYTDDTICTLAVADALLRGQQFGPSIHSWCRRFPLPKGGYGGRFRRWVESDTPTPYGSFGNGSAMRVSPIGWWEDNLEKLLLLAKNSAECSHNHPDGINGARAVAVAIRDCRNWRAGTINSYSRVISPNNILEYGLRNALRLLSVNVSNGFNLDLNLYRNRFDETIRGTVPVALYIVMKSHSFEDAIRRAVSLGADADTLGAIVGSIAEAIWDIPEWMKVKAMSYLTPEMRSVVQEFYIRVYKNTVKSIHNITQIKEYNMIPHTKSITPGNIQFLAPHQVFVFGSNLAGHHMGGAAKLAHHKFGAVWGVGDGPAGRTYAIPTMHGGLNMIQPYVRKFVNYAIAHPEQQFLLTRVGCGIAGFSDGEMASLFNGGFGYPSIYHVPNITVPQEWIPYLHP